MHFRAFVSVAYMTKAKILLVIFKLLTKASAYYYKHQLNIVFICVLLNNVLFVTSLATTIFNYFKC